MAKVTFGGGISEARGKIGGVMFGKSRGGNFARAHKLTNLTAGANITITGTWPNQTIALTSPLTGPLRVGNGTGAQAIYINGDATGLRVLQFNTAGVGRWAFITDNTPEAGLSAGSNFHVHRYNDAGTWLGTPIWIRRSDGQVGINNWSPTQQLDVGGSIQASDQLISTKAVGTPPLDVTSTTEVPNLNAGRVGGTEPTNAAADGQLLIGSGAGTADWGTPDGARVYNDAAISIPDSVATQLTFNTERYDNGGLHSTVTNTGRLTAQRAGVYIITAHVAFDANATGIRIVIIRLNGGDYIAAGQQNASSALSTRIAVSTIYALAATDYLEVRVYQSSGGALNVLHLHNDSPEFAMQWLGP